MNFEVQETPMALMALSLPLEPISIDSRVAVLTQENEKLKAKIEELSQRLMQAFPIASSISVSRIVVESSPDPLLDSLLGPARKAALMVSARASQVEALHPSSDGMLHMAEAGRGRILALQNTIQELNVRIEELGKEKEIIKKDVKQKCRAAFDKALSVACQSQSEALTSQESKLNEVRSAVHKIDKQNKDMLQLMKSERQEFESKWIGFENEVSRLKALLEIKERKIFALREQVLDAESAFSTKQRANEAYKKSISDCIISIDRRWLILELQESIRMIAQEGQLFTPLSWDKAQLIYNKVNNVIGKI